MLQHVKRHKRLYQRMALMLGVFVFIWLVTRPAQTNPTGKTDVISQNDPDLTLTDWDENIYTQGLAYDPESKRLYVSSGGYGQSFYGYLNENNNVIPLAGLPDTQFAEGVALIDHGDRLWQLTWREKDVYKRDTRTGDVIDTSRIDGQGWGLTDDPDRAVLYQTDGSQQVTVRNPKTFDPVDSFAVEDQSGKPIRKLNDLAYHDDHLYINVYKTDLIIRVPLNQEESKLKLDKIYDLSDPVQAIKDQSTNPDVLNGIEYLSDGQFILTGKHFSQAMVLPLD